MLFMVDPDAPPKTPNEYWLHWYVADIEGSDLKSGIGSSSIRLTGISTINQYRTMKSFRDFFFNVRRFKKIMKIDEKFFHCSIR